MRDFQTAAAIVATAISIDRTESDSKLIGYYGVFPRELQSGVDKFGRPIPPGKKIMCRQVNDLLRGLLWQCAKCASGVNDRRCYDWPAKKCAAKNECC